MPRRGAVRVLLVRNPLRNALQFDGECVHIIRLGLQILQGMVFGILPLGHLLFHAPASSRPLVEFPLHGVKGGCRLLSGGNVAHQIFLMGIPPEVRKLGCLF